MLKIDLKEAEDLVFIGDIDRFHPETDIKLPPGSQHQRRRRSVARMSAARMSEPACWQPAP